MQRIERDLKDRVRLQLGLPPPPTRQSLTPADYARRQGLDPSYDLPHPQQNGQEKETHLDDRIQTLLFPDQMERKLASIRDSARTVLSEMGINTLYTAFGFLEWYEQEGTSDRRFFAPLLLHPVEMGRVLFRQTYHYFTTSTEDDSEINLTLKKRLLDKFSLVLPDFEEDDTPEGYFAKVEDAIQNRQRWRVRRFVTIGIFAFGRLAMYHDLDPERWPDDKALHLHPVLVELLSGSNQVGALYAPDEDVDQPGIAAKVPLLITEADSSQFAAIADVMDGKNLTIKGPPGTGKSQTITNIIAAALVKGMKVLFVAEKMAALEVVKKRLDDAGLGAFCLELHSTKARKQDVLTSLRQRLELQCLPEPSALTATIDEHERLRKQLTWYVGMVNQPFGQTGKSLQQLFWAGTRISARVKELGLPVGLNNVVLDGTLSLTAIDLDRQRQALVALEKCTMSFTQTYGALAKHPWVGMPRDDLSPFAQQELLQALEDWRKAFLTLEREGKRIETEFGLPAPTTLDETSRLARALALLPKEAKEILTNVLPRLQSEEVLTALEKFCGMVQRWKDLKNALATRLQSLDRLPEATTIHTLEAERHTLTVGGQSFTGTVSELATFAKHWHEFARLADAHMTFARRFFQAAGIHAALTTSTLRTMLEMIEILRSTPRAIMLKRCATLLDETSRPVLAGAAREAQRLRERQQALNTSLAFSVDESPQDYRRCAAVLRATGFFGRLFGSEFKRARTVWRGACKVRKKASPMEMATELEALAEHLEAVREFCSNDRLKTICGVEFDGLATDFDSLLAINDFARQVEGCFPGTMSGHREVRRLLLEADRTTLDAALAEADAAVVSQLQTFLATLESKQSLDGDTDLEAVYRDSLQVATQAEQLHRACKDAGLHDEVALEDLPILADDLMHCAKLTEAIECDEEMKKLLGVRFLGTGTDLELLDRTAQLCRQLQVQELPQATRDRLLAIDLTAKLDGLQHLRRTLEAVLEHQTQTCHESLRVGSIKPGVFFHGNGLTEIPLTTAVARLERALGARDELPAWVAYNRLCVQAEEMGLKPILETYEKASMPFEHLEAAFEYVFYRTILKQAYERYPQFKRFSGLTQEAARRRFQEIDRTIIGLRRRQLAAALVRAEIARGTNWGQRRTWTDLHLIQHEMGKQKRHIPLRDLLLRAGRAIQQMKPCWMMSPASVAQFVQPGGVTFDLAVIDEASQMKPEDALGAIGRSRQCVVVGDPQQLPPTSFFDRIDMPSDDDDQDDAIDNESILDLALSVFRPARELRWHYRSRHESLIAFSNKHFYDGKLVVFPSPFPHHDDYGVEYRKVDGLYTPKAGVNLLEARTVAEAAEAFMASYPERSLGIVTINQAQREVLTEEMDRLFAHSDHAEIYRKRWEGTLEPFFVKNLENVQGDERDVMFISTVYGPEQFGGRVAQRFGPINATAGHRRLNVLFTRAKEKVVIFSSMKPEDVIPTATSRLGVGILKHYLTYARDGRHDPGTPSGREPDSDFEVFVADRLRQHGFEIVPQVGVAGYFIDLAVRDPRNRDHYVLGIECDGATYHSAKSARDRDRLRQEILEEMGWNIYRIWSTDWFSDPEREMKKLLRHIQGLTSLRG